MIFLLTSTTAFAKSTPLATTQQIYMTSFVDTEGKKNTVEIYIPQTGTSQVKYYIEEVLQNTVETTVTERNQVNVVVIDAKSSTKQQFIAPISDYITNDQTVVDSSSITRAYSYLGKINYNTYYDSLGYGHNYKLSVYQQTGLTLYEYRTLNAAKGTLASIAISVVAAVLTVICPALAVFSTNLFYAAAYAAGVTIVGGIVQGAISKTYYTRATNYDIQALDPDTSRQRFYSAKRYQVALDGGGYSSDYYYEGYLPWNTNAVAYWMFSDFWVTSYPGVKSYT